MRTNYEKIIVNHYIVYDLQDNYIFEGTCKEICHRLDITKSAITKAVQNKAIVRRKYKIVLDEEYYEEL